MSYSRPCGVSTAACAADECRCQLPATAEVGLPDPDVREYEHAKNGASQLEPLVDEHRDQGRGSAQARNDEAEPPRQRVWPVHRVASPFIHVADRVTAVRAALAEAVNVHRGDC